MHFIINLNIFIFASFTCPVNVSFFLQNFWKHFFIMHTLHKFHKWTHSVQQNAVLTHAVPCPQTQNTRLEYLSHIQTLNRGSSCGLALSKLYFPTLRDTTGSTLHILTSTSLLMCAFPWCRRWLVWLVIWYHHEANQSIQLSQNSQLTQLHERKRSQ